MKYTYYTLLLLFLSTSLGAQVQTPAEFLGYAIGTQFSRHADVVDYFEHVASQSAYVTFQKYGKTNERRPLTYAVISSPQNIANLETIRKNHLQNAGLVPGNSTSNMAVVWLSYNVHGNEASSTEAAMSTVYKLITEKKDWLQNTIVILDPCVNPDGRDRYANWYNQVKATPYDVDPIAAEHNEPWPGGRPNHYLFDLNRDWAWATQVETQQRLKVYNQWMPHIHVDFHEQGINEPYYFAPAAEPFHEIITPFQRDFQTQIGKNHARYFDEEGWLFFTRERFDLLYPSYGDTYPTFMGAIGMTYEQAGHGRAGLGITTDEGTELTLIDRVKHHTVTGLSTVEMGSKNAAQINTEFRKFFTENSNLQYKSYVLQGHPDKIKSLANLLDLHEISYGFASSGTVSGYQYSTQQKGSIDAKGALVVSTNQPKGKMVKALLEPDAKLTEPLTYDITAWSLPHAYGLDAVASTSLVNASGTAPYTTEANKVPKDAAGVLVAWKSFADGKFLAALLQEGFKVRFSEKDLSFKGQKFDKGTLILTKSDNQKMEDWTSKLTTLATKHQQQLVASSTSFGDTNTDFGSPDIKLIENKRIGLLRGDGTSSLSYGALWHFFEQQLHYPVTSIDTGDFSGFALKDLDVLIMPSGWYGRALNDNTLNDLKEWMRAGGKVIAMSNAVNSFIGKDGFGISRNEAKEGDAEKSPNLTPYDQRERESVKNFITGSIYKTTLDATHPMAFGYTDTYYSLKLGSDSYKFLDNGYNVGYLKDTPISVAGFSGENAKEGLTNAMTFGYEPMGRGGICYLVDDVVFRAFWENGKLLLVNSIFFAGE